MPHTSKRTTKLKKHSYERKEGYLSVIRDIQISRRRFLYFAAGCALSSAAAILLPSCSQASSSSSDEGKEERNLFLFNTSVNLSAYCSAELMDKAVDRCNYFEQKFSRTIEESDIGRINASHKTEFEIAPETADIIKKSFMYSQDSNGLFDISIGAVTTLWDFDKGVKPDDADLKEAITHIGWEKIHVTDTTVTLDDPDMKLDLGGIAKGYIADDLAQLFRDGGCESAILNLGGNIYALGNKPDGSQWKVGVRNPNKDADQTVIASCTAQDESVVTSGLYERYFEQDGTRYYHILDPKTGYPAKTDLDSSSIVCKQSIDGDAYATVLFLLGREEALVFLEKHDALEGILVDNEGKISESSGKRFDLENTEEASSGERVAVVHDADDKTYELPLDTDQEITVQTDLGKNVVRVEGGKVSVVDSDCPNHDCMHQGAIDGSFGQQIVCLPHKLWIEVVEK